MPHKHELVCLRHQSYSFKNSKLSVNLFYIKYFSIGKGIVVIIEMESDDNKITVIKK
jgi:transcription antitermination factor NusA-like protein